MRVTLLITGSIAAYKSAEIVRELKKRGHTVRVGMSPGASQFVTPLTLQTLSGEPVATDLFNLEEESRIGHISLADETDLVLVAPATANFIAKAALGLADDLPSTVMLATRAKILICPAMNVNMWENPITQENVQRLRGRGAEILEPDSGELACGWEGRGRLPDPAVIVGRAELLTESPLTAQVSRTSRVFGGSLAGKTVVVTAGPTREMLNPIRFISNRSSGKMGIALAEEAAGRGAVVHLLLGPVRERLSAVGIRVTNFDTALDLKQKLESVLVEAGPDTTLFMAAAPGDFRAAEISAKKLKGDKNKGQSLQLAPNPDIIREISEHRSRYQGLKRIVAFCAESASGETLEESAAAKLKFKKVDFIVANAIAESFGTDTTSILLLGSDGTHGESKKVSKRMAAAWLLDKVIGWMIPRAELAQALLDLNIDGLPEKWLERPAPGSDIVAVELAEASAPSAIIEESSAPFSGLSLEELAKIASTCTRCRLCEKRTNVVFGVGNTNSPLICFIGEGPGADEDRAGEPFVGRSGQLLTAAIEKGLGLRRSDIYIANVVKCRPPENRAPLPDEMATCSPYLVRQLELIKPKVIVTLGQTPQLALTGVKSGITKLRGQWLDWRGIPVMPTFHPAYLLRNPPAKKPFWEDLKSVMKRLGLTEPGSMS